MIVIFTCGLACPFMLGLCVYISLFRNCSVLLVSPYERLWVWRIHQQSSSISKWHIVPVPVLHCLKKVHHPPATSSVTLQHDVC